MGIQAKDDHGQSNAQSEQSPMAALSRNGTS